MTTLATPDYKSLFENFPGLLLLLAPDSTLLAASHSFLQTMQLKKEDISGRELISLLTLLGLGPGENDIDIVKSIPLSVEDGKARKSAVQRIGTTTKGGKQEDKYWEPLITPVFNEGGEVVYVMLQLLDVTGRQDEKEKLRRAKNDYELLVNSVQDYAIFMMDADGCIATWNSGAAVIKGYSESEVVGRRVDLFYTEEDRREGVPAKNLQKAKEYGHFETEGWRVRKDGTLFWANVIITALYDEHNLLYGYSKITRDISERRKAQEKVELLSRQINQSHDAIYIVDADRKILSWNKGAENLYGFTAEEALGRDPNILLQTALESNEIERVVSEIAVTDYWSGEILRRTKAGDIIYVHASVSTIRNRKGAVIGYTSVSFDITEQKHLRKEVDHLARLVEQSSEAILSRGIDQRIISWNRGAELLFGYTKAEAIGKTAIELGILKSAWEEIEALTWEIVEKGSVRYERLFFHKNGTSFIGSFSATAVKNAHGEMTSIVFMIKDISQIKQWEQQLQRSNEMLEEQVKIRTAQVIKTERRYRALIENSSDIITLLDETLKVVYRSPSSARVAGWTDEEIMRASGTKLIHPDDLLKAEFILREVMANPDRPYSCLLRSKHKNGHYMWVEGVVINLLNDEAVGAIVLNFRDVTKRIKAEEKLASSEVFYRSLIENSAEGISLLDESSNVIYRSPSAYRIIGDSPKENSINQAHPEDIPKLRARFRESIENPSTTIRYEVRFMHASGVYHWFEGTFTNLLNVAGVNAVVANYRDISERKLMEGQLKEREEQLRLFIEHSPASLAMFDKEMRYISVSRRWMSDIVLEERDLTGKSHYDIFPDIPEAWKEVHRRCLRGEVLKQENDQFERPDGQIAWLRWEVRPWHKATGEIGGIIIFAEDISDRKMAENELHQSFLEKQALAERLWIILNTLPANIALLNDNGVIIDVNEAWRGFADDNGLAGEHYCIGHSYIDICLASTGPDEEDGKKVARGIRSVLNKEITEFVMEYPCHSPAAERWFRMVVTPLRHSSYGGAVVMHTDISELRQLEKERLRAKTEDQRKITRAMLQGQEKERDAIGRELHDNVNQILVGTKLLLSMAEKDPVTHIDLIHSCVDNLQNAIDENRKIGHGLVAPDFDSESLSEQLLNLTNKMLKISNIDVTIDTSNFRRGMLDDQRMLAVYRIVQEQCTNIVKYAQASKVSIVLKTSENLFTMIISDDGVGVDTGKVTAGIGLKNIKGRLSVFNGTLTTRSAPGKGFTMELTVPLD